MIKIEKNIPVHNKFPLGKLWIFFGKPKVGKSTFAATWNNPLIFDFENGTTEIECSVVKPKNLDEFKRNLADKDLLKFDTIVIDTFDIVYSMIADATVERMNRQFKTQYSYVGEFPMGGGWANSKNDVDKFIKQYLDPLLNQGKTIILLLHEKSEVIKRKGEDDRTVYNISLPGQTAALVTGAAYTIGRVYIEDGGKNAISFSPAVDATGSRSRALAGKRIPLTYDVMVKTIEKYTPGFK